VEALASALHEAHRQGLVHGAIRPSRIFFDSHRPDAAPKLAGFGDVPVHHNYAALAPGTTEAGHVCYLSPEQTRGEGGLVAPATDVYALGALLFQLLTARPPFLGATVSDTVHQIRERQAPLPSDINPAVPPELDYICWKCLEKEPLRRYGSAQEVAADLHRFLAGTPVLSWPKRVIFWARCRPVAAGLIAVAALACLFLLSSNSKVRGLKTEVEALRKALAQASETPPAPE
jgi:serine/threonine protein kinase